jgi:hypothetical protein
MNQFGHDKILYLRDDGLARKDFYDGDLVCGAGYGILS